jgi:hypothetical protein
VLLASLAEYCRPASSDEILVELLKLARLFGPLDDEQIGEYVDLLSDLPLVCLQESVERCRRRCRVYPKVADLLENAVGFHRLLTVRTRLETAIWRLEKDW